MHLLRWHVRLWWERNVPRSRHATEHYVAHKTGTGLSPVPAFQLINTALGLISSQFPFPVLGLICFTLKRPHNHYRGFKYVRAIVFAGAAILTLVKVTFGTCPRIQRWPSRNSPKPNSFRRRCEGLQGALKGREDVLENSKSS